MAEDLINARLKELNKWHIYYIIHYQIIQI
jgi:hypothetical protein